MNDFVYLVVVIATQYKGLSNCFTVIAVPSFDEQLSAIDRASALERGSCRKCLGPSSYGS